jgi:uncharacterized protein (DUF302 family)
MKTDPVDSIQVAHQAIEIDVAYDRFTQNLEKILGRFDPAVTATRATDPRQADEDMKLMEGEQSLMIFGSHDHGTLFLLIGERRKAKRYTLGNPRVAIKMTSHDIRAGLYVPLTVLVYEVGENLVRVEFDQPSSLLGQFNNIRVNEVAKELDAKLAKVIEKAAQLSTLQPD